MVLGAVLVLGLLGFVALRIPAVQDRVMDRAMDRLVSSGPDEIFEDDALRVLLCGSASPLPHPTRAGPCVVVIAGGRFYAVDVGPRSWNNMARWRIDGSRIGAVLLTHFHSDHIGELGEWDLQTWVAGRPGPLPVLGPPGVDRVVAGFEEAYALDVGYRIAHHGAELLAPEVAPMRAQVVPGPARQEGPTPAWVQGDLTITAFSVEHAPVRPAYGYRFDYKGRSVVVSGDTIKTASTVEAARGADVLFHEAQAQHIVHRIRQAAERFDRPRIAKIMSDIPDYHTSPVEAAEVANEAGVRLVVFYHLTPPPPLRLVETIFLRGVSDVRPDGWILGDDGLLVELPLGSDEVRTRSIE